MKIKKLGHCCLLINTNGVSILTDPGVFSDKQDDIHGIDYVLITHEHADHLHVDSLKQVLANNPGAKVFTNSGVAKLLDEANIRYSLLEGRDKAMFGEILVEAFDSKHEEIFEEIGIVQNTGYFIDEKLFYPGDSFCNPKKPVETLALPVAGPWCKIPEAIKYALAIKPKNIFPVHDGMIKEDRIATAHGMPGKVLGSNGINFVSMLPGDEVEF